MSSRVFPTGLVLACVAMSKRRNILLDWEDMEPLVAFLACMPEEQVHKNPSMFMPAAVAAGRWLAKRYPDLDQVDFPEGFRNDEAFQMWWARLLNSFATTMEVEPPNGPYMTDEERDDAADVARGWIITLMSS